MRDADTTETIDISLMRMLMDGPEVSLKGSPYGIADNSGFMGIRFLAVILILYLRTAHLLVNLINYQGTGT